MARTVAREFLKAFRFVVAFLESAPNPEAADAAVRLECDVTDCPVVSVTSLTGGFIELSQGHAWGYRPMIDALKHVVGKERNGAIVVQLLNGNNKASRRVTATFSDYEWLPLSLDAKSDSVALERILLKGVQYLEDIDDDVESD